MLITSLFRSHSAFGIQTKFKSFWRKYLSNGYKLSQLPLHRTTCVAILGAAQFLTHVPVYVSLNNDRSSTETFERQSNRWFSTSVNWPFTVLQNSAARSTFKWQFENWKTFWCLNKDHKINIPASHQWFDRRSNE